MGWGQTILSLRIRRGQGFALVLALAVVPMVASATTGPVQRTYTQSLPAGVSLVSLGVATNTALPELFGPDCLAVRRWDPSSEGYVVPTVLHPGEGCEVVMGAAAEVRLTGTPVPAPRTLATSPGWNQLGNPFSVEVPWSRVRAVRNGMEKSLQRATEAGWIGRTYTVSGGSSRTVRFSGDTLGVGEGFWLKVKKAGVSLRFETQKVWTVMAYLDGDDTDMNHDFSDAFEHIQADSVGSDERVNLVVQFDRIPGDERFGGWPIAHRFYVTPGMALSEDNAVQDWGDGQGGREVESNDPETLRAFIVWAAENYPADHYVLLAGNHGFGWQGLFIDWTSYGDFMSLKGFAEALKASPVPFDILALDFCLMHTAEVLHELEGTPVDVVVGSEAPGRVWPLWDILRIPLESPDVTPEAWARSMVDLYVTYNRSQQAEDVTLSAFHLPSFADVTPAVRALAEACLDQNRTDEVPGKAQEVLAALDAARIVEGHGDLYPDTHGVSVYFPLSDQGFIPAVFNCCYTGEVTSFVDDALWRHLLIPYYNPLGGLYLDWRLRQARNGLTEIDSGDYVDLYALCSSIAQPGHAGAGSGEVHGPPRDGSSLAGY